MSCLRAWLRSGRVFGRFRLVARLRGASSDGTDFSGTGE